MIVMTEALLKEILSRAQVQEPDGRALYRYSVDETTFVALRKRLQELHHSGQLVQLTPSSAALFSLYVSEWFRRVYSGGPYRWVSPLPEVISELTELEKKSLARRGLAWWRLTPRRMLGGEMRLLSLVREGGFPIRLLETRENGPIALHLRHLFTRLEAAGEASETSAMRVSQAMGSALGPFDHEEFHTLCAELVNALLALKLQALAAAPPGVPASAWLDAAWPGWRDALPFVLSEGGARLLIDELLNEDSCRIGGDAGCDRVLLQEGEEWVAAVTLNMDGNLSLPSRISPSEGRLRVYAAGALASVYAGELGLLEPPAEIDQSWLCRRRNTAATAPFAFSSPVEVKLRTSERALESFIWPRGRSLRAELLIFADPRGDSAKPPPVALTYLGCGSLRTRHNRVWLLTPPDFLVSDVGGCNTEVPVWRGSKHLYDITSSVHAGQLGRPGYRIELGSDRESSHELVFEGEMLTGAQAADNDPPVFAGTPRLTLRGLAHSRLAKLGQVNWRNGQKSAWRDWVQNPPDANHDGGLVDVVWQDEKSRAALDRRRIAIVPEGARIIAKPASTANVIYTLEHLAGWALTAGITDVTAVCAPNYLEVTFSGRPRRHLPLILTSATATIRMLADVPISGGGFYDASGGFLEDGARLMLEDLRGAFAFASGRERLTLRGQHGAESHYKFDDEQPLWAISEDILRLLSASSDLDAVITLELGQSARRLKVGRYATKAKLTDSSVSWDGEPLAGPGLRLDWFSVVTAERRVLSEGSWDCGLPDDLAGPGILLPRQNGKVVGRPTLAPGRTLSTVGLGRLQQAGLLNNPSQRRRALGRWLDALAEDSETAAFDRRFLLQLITSLDGTPPAAIDALAMLPEHPAALIGVAAAAETEDARAQVWLLERELPFLWSALPIALWIVGFATRRQSLERQLVAGGIDKALAYSIAADAVRRAADDWGRLDLSLGTGLALVGIATPPSCAIPKLDEAVQAWAQRNAGNVMSHTGLGRPSTPITSRFRRSGSILTAKLPPLPFDEHLREGVDAPLAVALAAASSPFELQHISLDPEQRRLARDARAQDPQSFVEIIAAALSLLARGAPLALASKPVEFVRK